MLGRRDDPFPFEAVRDLLGLVRAIHAAKKRERPDARLVLERIAKVGQELEAAYSLAAESRPDTVGMRAAWLRAEEATRAAGELVAQTDEARPIVLAAAARVRR